MDIVNLGFRSKGWFAGRPDYFKETRATNLQTEAINDDSAYDEKEVLTLAHTKRKGRRMDERLLIRLR